MTLSENPRGTLLFCICFCVVFGFSHGLSVAAEPIQYVELVPEAVREESLTGCLACIKPVIASEVCFFHVFVFYFFFHKQESTNQGKEKQNFTVSVQTSYWIDFQSVLTHKTREFKQIPTGLKTVDSLLCFFFMITRV